MIDMEYFESDRDRFVNELMKEMPQSWDGDESAESVCVEYVRELERRVKALGGSTERWPSDAEDPMPVFVLKAKDKLALDAVLHYGEQCIAHGLRDQAREVGNAASEMAGWQNRHRELLKFPDHKHVPVVATGLLGAEDQDKMERGK